jgi:hypothetical protein
MAVTDTMLRVSPRIRPAGAGGRGKERIIMANTALAEELDELYRLDASESEPEDDDEEDDEEDDEKEEPRIMPQG